MLPLESPVNAVGQSSAASRAGPPSPEYPGTLTPATAVMTPVGDILQMRALPASAMYNEPRESINTPLG